MKNGILVRGARQLLTLRGPASPRRGDAMRDLGVIEDGSVLIVDGVIESIGPTRRIENLARARSATEISAAGRVVMPGFVDSHTHLVAPPPRIVEYRSSFDGLHGDSAIKWNAGFAAVLNYMRHTPAGTLEFHARKYIEAILRHGTTTLEVKSGYGLNNAAELKILRVIAALGTSPATVVPTYFGAHAVPPEYQANPEGYLALLCSEQIPRVAERKLARFADVLCDPAGFSIDHARAYLRCARRAGLHIKIHGEQALRTGAASLAIEEDATSIDGLNEATREDCELLARARTLCTLMPAPVYQGSYARFPPARNLIDAGAAAALATGFDPTMNSTFSMQMAISLACSQMKMTAEEAISASTINGAHALETSHGCGSLEYGKDADLIMMNAPDYREIPYHFGANSVCLVIRKGVVVYREGGVACDA